MKIVDKFLLRIAVTHQIIRVGERTAQRDEIRDQPCRQLLFGWSPAVDGFSRDFFDQGTTFRAEFGFTRDRSGRIFRVVLVEL